MSYEIWLEQDKNRLRLPVLPIESGLNINLSTSNESHRVSKLGEVTVIQDSELKMFQFSSFFPAQYAPYCEYRNVPKPWDVVNLIERWERSNAPIRLIFTGHINSLVSIESFNYREQGGAVGDVYYDISLKEFRQVTIRQVKHKPSPRPTPPKPKPKKKSSKVRRHTVKSGDTLWALAGKYYKDSLKWRKIWNVKSNKDMMVKRDSRNRRQPGHWIYPGQKLIIP